MLFKLGLMLESGGTGELIPDGVTAKRDLSDISGLLNSTEHTAEDGRREYWPSELQLSQDHAHHSHDLLRKHRVKRGSSSMQEPEEDILYAD